MRSLTDIDTGEGKLTNEQSVRNTEQQSIWERKA